MIYPNLGRAGIQQLPGHTSLTVRLVVGDVEAPQEAVAGRTADPGEAADEPGRFIRLGYRYHVHFPTLYTGTGLRQDQFVNLVCGKPGREIGRKGG